MLFSTEHPRKCDDTFFMKMVTCSSTHQLTAGVFVFPMEQIKRCIVFSNVAEKPQSAPNANFMLRKSKESNSKAMPNEWRGKQGNGMDHVCKK